MKPAPTSLWVVDVCKAVASQVIVWHHFIAYGPLARTLRPHAVSLFDWLYYDGRMAVQAFLVVGGFLAARSLAPRPEQLAFDPAASSIVRLAWSRYLRLLRPYLLALLLAIVVAACARFLMSDPDTPAAASPKQVLFHVLLIHDIAGVDALSAGVWYVAIDFQLYCLLLFLLWLSQHLAIALRLEMQTLRLFLLVGLAALSLLWFNRVDSLEMWAIFFVGAYGLGVLVQWSTEERSKYPWLAILLLIYVLALVLEWRARLVVSLMTAALLGLGLHTSYHPGHHFSRAVGWLSRISYSVFLIHYPIALLVGTLVAWLWPESISFAVVGYLTAWLVTLGLSHVLYHHVERRR